MTPRTDALRNLYDHAAPVVELWQLAYDLERELNEAKAELARAMRVVEAADTYEANLDDDSLLDLREAIREWKAGR